MFYLCIFLIVLYRPPFHRIRNENIYETRRVKKRVTMAAVDKWKTFFFFTFLMRPVCWRDACRAWPEWACPRWTRCCGSCPPWPWSAASRAARRTPRVAAAVAVELRSWTTTAGWTGGTRSTSVRAPADWVPSAAYRSLKAPCTTAWYNWRAFTGQQQRRSSDSKRTSENVHFRFNSRVSDARKKVCS